MRFRLDPTSPSGLSPEPEKVEIIKQVGHGAVVSGRNGVDGKVQAIVAGSNVTVDSTDPARPIVSATGGGGSGDVVGPSSSTDNAIARYDGTTGKLIQNSLASVADDGTIDSGTGKFTGGSYSGTTRNYVDPSVNVGFPALDVIFPGGASTGQGDFSLGSGVFRAGQVSVLGTNDIFFQLIPLTIAGYGYIEGWGGAGLVLGTGGSGVFGDPSGSTGGPIIFSPSRVEKMRLLENGMLNVKNNITTDFTGNNETRIIGIGTNSGLTPGSTGIFRFADQYNQMSVTYGSTLDVLAYHGTTITNDPLFGSYIGSPALRVKANSSLTASAPVLVVMAAPSQSADIQQWQDSSGTTVASIGAGGSLSLPITTVSSSITLDSTHSTVLVDATSSAKNITLPSASSFPGRLYTIKKKDSSLNTVTIVGTIDGATNPTLLTQYKYMGIQSDGTSWYIVANN